MIDTDICSICEIKLEGIAPFRYYCSCSYQYDNAMCGRCYDKLKKNHELECHSSVDLV